MTRYAQGKYIPKNPQKYVGKHTPTYRSGWEFTFCNFCDLNESIIYWASEAIAIPYIHPLTGKRSTYIPDFFVVYNNKFGQQIAEVVEIKPKKQSLIESKVASARDRAVVAVNHAKWDSASKWCKTKGYTFRVITEENIFHQGKKK
jgi:hypothetical protein